MNQTPFTPRRVSRGDAPSQERCKTGIRPTSVHRRIAIIGAGPFGLALAAKLEAAKADYVLLGPAMSFWREHVPRGMRLISDLGSCSLSHDEFDSAAYERTRGIQLQSRWSAQEFVAYALWFKKNTSANSDERVVVSLTRANGIYKIGIDNGDEITCDHVVVAIGLKVFAHRPARFATLSPQLVSHTSDLSDLSDFPGKRVAIIGSGQSALEYAALLAEENADIEVITRSRELVWRTGHPKFSSARGTGHLYSAIRVALKDPDLYRHLPGFIRDFWLKRAMRPAIVDGLKSRLSTVHFTLGRNITAAHMSGNRVELELDDNSSLTVDRVVLGTGYRVDVNAISFLARELRLQIRQHEGYPELNGRMESTVPRLYFTGAAAARSFGPNMWFLYGAPWAAERISHAFCDERRITVAKNSRLESLPATTGRERFPGELQLK